MSAVFRPCYVAAVEAPPEQTWPGQRLGVPADGPGSVAGWWRRIAALFIDWFLSLLAVAAVTRQNPWAFSSAGQTTERYAVGLLFLEIWIFTALIGGSAGQVVMRTGVRMVSAGRLDPVRALVRTLLIFLVIPAAISDRDKRGLHDLAVGSVVVRR
jgi:uncharacterized RDD family membrane protein YckC